VVGIARYLRGVVVGSSRALGEALVMNLTPPSQLAFVLSVFLAILALLVRYAHVAIPVVSNHSFETLLVGLFLLLAGVIFRGF
jgi:hypothetical protein